MAMRLRTVDGMLVALCAAACPAEPGDFYLDDDQQYALMVKFQREEGNFYNPEEARRVQAIEGERFCNRVTDPDFEFPPLDMVAD